MRGNSPLTAGRHIVRQRFSGLFSMREHSNRRNASQALQHEPVPDAGLTNTQLAARDLGISLVAETPGANRWVDHGETSLPAWLLETAQNVLSAADRPAQGMLRMPLQQYRDQTLGVLQ